MPRRSERITFAGGQGARLAGRLDWPVGRPRAFALLAHCFTCSKDLAAVARIGRALAERGLAVLRFDFTGLGHSDGEFESSGFEGNVADVVRAADWLREAHEAPALLIGHSLGGTAMLAAAPRIPEARAVVTLNAPADPAHVRRLLGDDAERIEEEGRGEVEIAGRTFPISRELLEGLEGHRLEETLASLRKALLVMHGPRDTVVGIENATRIFTAARHPKSFVSLDSADHLLSRRADATYAANVLAAWATRFLPAPPEERVAPEPGEVRVRETGEGRFAQAVAAGRHRMRADEPVRMGGDDTGPTPYGYLLAALGACTSMTLRLYAERKSWPLERVEVRLRHGRSHARDCESCEGESRRVERIERELHLEGDLDEAQQRRLVEMAERCPVHRTLTGEVDVVTRLAEERQALRRRS